MAHLENAGRPSAQRAKTREPVGKLRDVLPNLRRPLPAAITVTALLLWEWRSRAGGLSTLFFPAPSTIIRTLARLLIDGELAVQLGTTLSRVLLGFALGAVPGLMLGLAMGWSRHLRAVVDPFIAAFHPIPKSALLPLIIIVFGIGETSKLVSIGIGSFFPMVINCMAGVQQIAPTYFEVARNYGAGPGQVFRRVILPGSLPLVLTGARISLNIALLITITTEMVAAKQGLGVTIWFSWQTMRTEELYASLILVSALGIGLNRLLSRLKRCLVPWHEELQKGQADDDR